MLTVVMLQGCEKVLYDLPRHSDAVCQTDRMETTATQCRLHFLTTKTSCCHLIYLSFFGFTHNSDAITLHWIL